MPKNVKNTVELKGGLEVERDARPDIKTARLPESSFIAQTPRPNLDNRGLWVKQAFDTGVSLPDIIRGSGLNVTTIYSICGLSPDDNRDKYEELCKLRKEIIFGR